MEELEALATKEEELFNHGIENKTKMIAEFQEQLKELQQKVAASPTAQQEHTSSALPTAEAESLPQTGGRAEGPAKKPGPTKPGARV